MLNGVEAIQWINNYLKDSGEQLFQYQEYMIQAWCDGKKVATARALGRSYTLDLFKLYIESKLEELEDNSPENPDICLDYTHGVVVGLMDETNIDKLKVDKEYFNKEFLCQYSKED